MQRRFVWIKKETEVSFREILSVLSLIMLVLLILPFINSVSTSPAVEDEVKQFLPNLNYSWPLEKGGRRVHTFLFLVNPL